MKKTFEYKDGKIVETTDGLQWKYTREIIPPESPLLKNLKEKVENISKSKTEKRTDYINWDEFFMGVAIVASLRSKDPNTQVGACIVNDKKHIIGVGYNGFPNGCSDDILPWEKTGDPLETKYLYIVHAEANCIINKTGNIENSIMYVSLFPCNECSKLIIQSGIKEIKYLEDKYNGTDSNISAKKMLNMANIKLTQFVSTRFSLNVHF